MSGVADTTADTAEVRRGFLAVVVVVVVVVRRVDRRDVMNTLYYSLFDV